MMYADWTAPQNTEDADTLICRVRDNDGRKTYTATRDRVVAAAAFPREEAIAIIRAGTAVPESIDRAYFRA